MVPSVTTPTPHPLAIQRQTTLSALVLGCSSLGPMGEFPFFLRTQLFIFYMRSLYL